MRFLNGAGPGAEGLGLVLSVQVSSWERHSWAFQNQGFCGVYTQQCPNCAGLHTRMHTHTLLNSCWLQARQQRQSVAQSVPGERSCVGPGKRQQSRLQNTSRSEPRGTARSAAALAAQSSGQERGGEGGGFQLSHTSRGQVRAWALQHWRKS